jgi:transcriptional regulator
VFTRHAVIFAACDASFARGLGRVAFLVRLGADFWAIKGFQNVTTEGKPCIRTQFFAMVRARSFGILSVNGADGPLAAHIPFELGEGEVFLHLARSNPIARAALPAPALLAVSGPDAYVSPDWYGADDQVPTWNYIAVHLRGVLEPLPEAALRGHLARVSAHMEGQLAPKPA